MKGSIAAAIPIKSYGTRQRPNDCGGGDRKFGIDYAALMAGRNLASIEATAAFFADQLPTAWKSVYEQMTPRMMDIRFIRFGTFDYFYDDYATLEITGKVPYDPVAEARIVGVFGYTKPQQTARDDFRLKGWAGPTEASFGKEWDKGHFMAHSLGGAVDQCEMNVFVQNRRLNRGWSEQGKRFRQMEKYCFQHPGTFCFSRPIYLDPSAKPSFLEFGVLKTDGSLWVERFQNA